MYIYLKISNKSRHTILYLTQIGIERDHTHITTVPQCSEISLTKGFLTRSVNLLWDKPMRLIINNSPRDIALPAIVPTSSSLIAQIETVQRPHHDVYYNILTRCNGDSYLSAQCFPNIPGAPFHEWTNTDFNKTHLHLYESANHSRERLNRDKSPSLSIDSIEDTENHSDSDIMLETKRIQTPHYQIPNNLPNRPFQPKHGSGRRIQSMKPMVSMGKKRLHHVYHNDIIESQRHTYMVMKGPSAPVLPIPPRDPIIQVPIIEAPLSPFLNTETITCQAPLPSASSPLVSRTIKFATKKRHADDAEDPYIKSDKA